MRPERGAGLGRRLGKGHNSGRERAAGGQEEQGQEDMESRTGLLTLEATQRSRLRLRKPQSKFSISRRSLMFHALVELLQPWNGCPEKRSSSHSGGNCLPGASSCGTSRRDTDTKYFTSSFLQDL
ncbi:hypothetical protein DBR06_SOUSAS14810073 [Sousa chinensis]|nr:hypothetical protein DBR06_SOUSAS14810073 [Sousa chinensis]